MTELTMDDDRWRYRLSRLDKIGYPPQPYWSAYVLARRPNTWATWTEQDFDETEEWMRSMQEGCLRQVAKALRVTE